MNQALIEALLAAMLALAPRQPEARLRTVATAIAHAASSRQDAAVLVTISWYETRFEHAGVPFGLVSWRRRLADQPLEAWAQASLAMLQMTERCGPSTAVRLGWYHTGRCRADDFSRRQARTVRAVLADLPASLVYAGTGPAVPMVAERATASGRRRARHRASRPVAHAP